MTETQHKQHAYEVAERLDVQSTDAVVVVGGDGSMSEVVQVIVLHPKCHNSLAGLLGKYTFKIGNPFKYRFV